MGIDIKDIPKIADKEFSVTLNAFFVVRWKDERLVIDQVGGRAENEPSRLKFYTIIEKASKGPSSGRKRLLCNLHFSAIS